MGQAGPDKYQVSCFKIFMAISYQPFAASFCNEISIGINAGHDLNLDNVRFFRQNIPGLLEVSIGHALVRDCLYLGLENTIQLYLKQLR